MDKRRGADQQFLDKIRAMFRLRGAFGVTHPTNIPRTKQLNLIGFDMLRIQQYIECFRHDDR